MKYGRQLHSSISHKKIQDLHAHFPTAACSERLKTFSCRVISQETSVQRRQLNVTSCCASWQDFPLFISSERAW
ncbi:hypothetical protein Q8A67_014845 [Cirrhinus molitorella]|uniref:Uncharacterized protein n=1 Tax=Cirrhinus molitorella TaxID=172907 RepID=A0AA88PHB1_9TELE|nr:hypothetical protein Q8A67_014845 [Cirrhinus molitorella]